MQDDDKTGQRAPQSRKGQAGAADDRPQEDPVEGDRATIERELDRQDKGKGQG